MIRIFASILLSIQLISSAQAATPPSLAGIIELVKAGDYDGARAMHEKLPHTPVDEIFLEAQIFTAKGQLAEAITAYRAILVARPELISARLLLADLLFAIGDWDAARFHFRILRDTADSTAEKLRYSRVLAEISRRTPSGYTTSFTLTPSTNINRGASSSDSGFILPFGADTVEQSGIGAQIGASAFLRVPQDSGGVLVFTASAVFTGYNNALFNTLSPALSAQYEKTEGRLSFTLGARVAKSFRNRDSDYVTFSLSHGGRYALDGRDMLTWSLAARSVQYDPSSALDGPEYSASLGLRRQINPVLAVDGAVKLSLGLPEAEHYQFRGIAVSGGVTRAWKGGWTTYTGIDLGQRIYDGIFPAPAVARRDEFIGLRANILNSTITWQGFAPRVNCLFLVNKSNVPLYDYNTTECGLQLTREY